MQCTSILFILMIALPLYGQEFSITFDTNSDVTLTLRHERDAMWWDLDLSYDNAEGSIFPLLRIFSESLRMGSLYGRGWYRTPYGQSFSAWSTAYEERTGWALSETSSRGVLFHVAPFSLWFLERRNDQSIGAAMALPFHELLSLYVAAVFIECFPQDFGWDEGYESLSGAFSRLYTALHYKDTTWQASLSYGIEMSRIHPSGHEVQLFLSKKFPDFELKALFWYRNPHFRALYQNSEGIWHFSAICTAEWHILHFVTKLAYEKHISLIEDIPHEDIVFTQRIVAELPIHERGSMKYYVSFHIEEFFSHYEFTIGATFRYDMKGIALQLTPKGQWKFSQRLLSHAYSLSLSLGSSTQAFSRIIFSWEEEWEVSLKFGLRITQDLWWCKLQVENERLWVNSHEWRNFFSTAQYSITVGFVLSSRTTASPRQDAELLELHEIGDDEVLGE